MDKYSKIETKINEYAIKPMKNDTIMINCIDTRGRCDQSNHNYNFKVNQRVIVHQYITSELSLNRLFDIAKEESLKLRPV